MADAHAEPQHDYHLVDPSPWPAVGSLSMFILAIGAIAWMRDWSFGFLMYVGLAMVAYTMFAWWKDVTREATFDGHHTPVVQLHHRYGVMLFIASEVMFFVAWFWAFFDVSLFPDATFAREAATGGVWPPVDVHTFDPWSIPFINTLILLLSGTTVTAAHHYLVEGENEKTTQWLIVTVLLGAAFTGFQVYEYIHASFAFAGNMYGATFYMATGFHGAHVLIGTIFLFVCLMRNVKGHFKPDHHFGFEAAAWYWHFVDVVWLFLFACIYVWAAGTPAAH